MGMGAVIGGLAVASSRHKGMRSLALAAGAFGLTMLAAAAVPTLATEVLALAMVGAGSVAFMSRGNTMLQLTADETMRGWVMALWAVAFLGTTPIGGPVVGYVAQHAGPRWGLALGGLAALTTTALAAFPHLRLFWQLNRDRARPTAQPRSVTGHRSFTDMVPTVATSSDREPAGKWAAAQPGPHAGWLSGTAGSFVSFLLSQFSRGRQTPVRRRRPGPPTSAVHVVWSRIPLVEEVRVVGEGQGERAQDGPR